MALELGSLLKPQSPALGLGTGQGEAHFAQQPLSYEIKGKGATWANPPPVSSARDGNTATLSSHAQLTRLSSLEKK